MHGGNRKQISRQFGVDEGSLIDFSTGINPLGYPGSLRRIVNRHLASVSEYPDPDYTELREALASSAGVSPGQVVQGNGSSELLPALLRSLNPPEVILPVPCYVDYELYCRRLGISIRQLPLSPDRDFDVEPGILEKALSQAEAGALLLVGNPGNPTGRSLSPGLVEKLAALRPDCHICVDEAYEPFLPQVGSADGDSITPPESLRPSPSGNIICLRSLTKMYAIPGIRLAYLLASAETADLVRKELPTWNLGTLASVLAPELLDAGEFQQDTIAFVGQEKRVLAEGLSGIREIRLFPGDAPFLLFRLEQGDPDRFYEAMILRGYVPRQCGDYSGLDKRYFRIGIRSSTDNLGLLRAVAGALADIGIRQEPKTVPRHKARRTPALMFQGTSSNAGKSLMTAAMCRVLADEGIKVAPFKAQNMSLNSYVTVGGGEMGRAQVLQAMAARVEPDVLMNPVLLKPTGDQGSQVIVNGQPWDSLQARQYYDRKRDLRNIVHQAYDDLCSRYDAVVLEGAGSPGEVNLKKHDIVNMSMARHASSPVILVGDIDRGGVYASFIGHMAVMEEWERELTAGFLVNKFRGDATLLEDAHVYVRRFTDKPVLGVMPWIRDHRLPEEDGVDFEERYGGSSGGASGDEGGHIVIGVLELPHISNSTDLDPFLNDPAVRLVRINSLEKYRNTRVDSVIIPGTRNVIGDFRHLKRLGLIDALTRDAEAGGISVFGICGGFQMLGRKISDPAGLEVASGTAIDGMGLLDMETSLEESKVLRQRETRLVDDDSRVIGYEIHHGRSSYREQDLFTDPDLGCRNGRIRGTYLHGIFENDGVRNHYLRDLGYDERSVGSGSAKTVDQALDDFSDVFRRSVDIDGLKDLMGL